MKAYRTRTIERLETIDAMLDSKEYECWALMGMYHRDTVSLKEQHIAEKHSMEDAFQREREASLEAHPCNFDPDSDRWGRRMRRPSDSKTSALSSLLTIRHLPSR